MAHEGHKRRSKYRLEAGGSSSSWGPSAQPKTLTKRQHPSTLCEESSHEDSPPRGSTLDSLEEFKCLKIRPPVAHTNREVVNYNKENREVVNYNKEDLRNIVTLHDKPGYSSAKERGTDERF
jgi:hypothetical protein